MITTILITTAIWLGTGALSIWIRQSLIVVSLPGALVLLIAGPIGLLIGLADYAVCAIIFRRR